jgi:hypothetical protein
MGLGGALLADSGNLSSLSSNPAGLAGLDAVELQIDASLLAGKGPQATLGAGGGMGDADLPSWALRAGLDGSQIYPELGLGMKLGDNRNLKAGAALSEFGVTLGLCAALAWGLEAGAAFRGLGSEMEDQKQGLGLAWRGNGKLLLLETEFRRQGGTSLAAGLESKLGRDLSLFFGLRQDPQLGSWPLFSTGAGKNWKGAEFTVALAGIFSPTWGLSCGMKMPLWKKGRASKPSAPKRAQSKGRAPQADRFQLEAAVQEKRVQLKWVSLPEAASYEVMKGLVPGAGLQRINENALKKNAYSEDLGFSGVTYFFQVRALDQAGRILGSSKVLSILNP